MKKRVRLLILGIVMLLCLCMVACDLQSGGLLGALLDFGSQELEDLPEDIVGTLPGVGEGDILDVETATDVEVETDPDYWASPALGAFDELNGEAFVILSNRQEDISPEELSADPVDDDLYRRDDNIQYTYGVRLDCIVETDYIQLGDMVRNDVAAGAGEYDLVYQHMVNSAINLAMSHSLHNLANVDYLDPEQAWWDQGCNNGFRFSDQIMMMSGDLLISSTQLTSAVFFNQRLFDERGLEYPYQDVREGTWTLDDMLKLTKDQTMDLDGDGRVNYKYDMYGLTGWALDCDYAYQFGAGGTMFTYDADHLPVYSAVPERLSAMYEKIYDLIVTNASFHVTVAEYINDNSLYIEPRNVFTEGRSLFFTGTLLDARMMVADHMSDTFGILPAPKYDEKQENYQSFVNGASPVAVLPLSLSDEQLTRSGYMMELLASSSYYMVEDSLHRSFVQNDNQSESLEMLDIITSHKITDFGYVYFHNDGLPCASLVQTALNNKSNSGTISKEIAKGERKIQKAVKKVYECYGYEYNY